MNDLKERIHENGIDYVLSGDYYIPEFQIPEFDRTIGHDGRLRKTYLNEYRPVLCAGLLSQGKLFEHCTDINKQALRRRDVIMEQLLLKWSITEDLKHEGQLGWVGLMNQARHCADEVILTELIYT